MRIILAILSLSILCGCALFKERETAENPEIRFMEERTEAVARGLIKDGKAANMEEALPLAKEIVAREVEDQKSAARENERQADMYQDRNERAE